MTGQTAAQWLPLIAPELALDPRVEGFLEMASLSVNVRAWAYNACLAQALLAAHLLTRFNLDSGPTVGGSVTMEKVGDIQTQYDPIKMEGDEELATTAYGARYAQMRRALPVRGITIGSRRAY